MKECPRCLCDKMKEPIYVNALSRRDNSTYICSECGVEEALIDARFMKPTLNEKCFIEEIFDISYDSYKEKREKRIPMKSKTQIKEETDNL